MDERARMSYPGRRIPSPQALMAEYAHCSAIVTRTTAIAWQSLGLFIGGALAAAGFVLVNLAKMPWYVVVVLAFFIVALLVLLKRVFFRRENWRIKIAYSRMREIEKELGLRIGWDYHVLDGWRTIPSEALSGIDERDRERWCELHRQHPSPGPISWPFVRWAINVVVVLWVLLAIAAFLVGASVLKWPSPPQ